MIEVTFLGPCAVTVDGEPLSGEATQRRRLAMLALLCTWPIRPVPRDRIVGCLWPESGEEAARHVLSAAIHVVRKAFGADAILTSGDQLQLNPDRVRVDVLEFEDAYARGDLERAVSLYRGPFLEGLVLSGAPAFEHWADGRREQLRQRCAAALEGVAVARGAAGDLDGAVEAWRRLAALDPYSARTTVGLMQALVAAGNRAGALQAARIHAELLDSEFDAVPDPEVTSLADELREEPAPSTASAAPPPAWAPDLPAAPAAEMNPSADPPEPPPTAGAAPTTRPRPRWWTRRGLAIAAALAAVLVATVVATVVAASRMAAGPSPPLRSIAVLPFAVPGADAADEFLGDGIAAEILDELALVPELRVLSWASTSPFRGTNLGARDLGQRLHVEGLLTGWVNVLGDELQVRVELARASDGTRLWSGKYNARRADLFALEDRVAQAVGKQLRVRIVDRAEAARGEGRRDPVAHELFLRARYAWEQRTPDALLRALTLFQQAIEQDSTYAWAYAGLADTYNILGGYDYGVLAPDSAYPAARAAARRAIELEPGLAPPHAALANVSMNHERDFTAAEASYRRAIDRDPSYTPAQQWLADLLIVHGRSAEALEVLQHALEFDPGSPLLFTSLAQHHYFAREPDRALDLLDHALELNPGFQRAYLLRSLVLIQSGRDDEAIALLEPMAAAARASDPVLAAVLGHAYARAGRTDEALAQLAWLDDLARSRYVPAEYPAIIHIGLGGYEPALDLLETALRRRSGGVIYMVVEPLADPLRSLPRFQRLVAAVMGG